MSPQTFYHSSVARATRRSHRSHAFLQYVLFTQVLSLLYVIYEFAKSVRRPGIFTVVLALLAVYIFSNLGRFISALSKQRRTRVAAIRAGELYRVPPDALTEIRRMVVEFATTLVPPYMKRLELELWISRSPGASPAVFQLGGRSCLCLPLGFI